MMSKTKKDFTYKGKLEEYQLYPPKNYVEYETDIYSSYQNYLYKRALYGLKALSEEELKSLCSHKKKRILKVHKKAQLVINKLKHQRTIEITNTIMRVLFPESPITSFLVQNCDIDDTVQNTLSFKDLQITKDQLVTAFIAEGVLPRNFRKLALNPNSLPKLKNEAENL